MRRADTRIPREHVCSPALENRLARIWEIRYPFPRVRPLVPPLLPSSSLFHVSYFSF